MKKRFTFIFTLTALLCLGTGNLWGAAISIDVDHPYSNNFESNIDGFSKVGYSSATITQYSTSGKVRDSYALRVYTYSTNNVVLIFPEFDDDLSNLSVSFYAARTYSATTSIGYITNVSNASSFVSKKSFSCETSIGGPYSYDFSTAGSIPAGARIAISYSGQSSRSSYLFIDDITVTSTSTASACKKPKALTQGAVTTTSATFTWTKGDSETSWQYVCLPAASSLDWTGAETANSESATVSGLTAGTKYRFYVRSDCESEQSSATSAEFRTVYALPFSENFTGLTSGIPEGWDNSEGTTTTDTYKWNYFSAGYGAVPCLRFNSYSNGYKNNFLKTPAIFVDKAATLSFAYKNPKGGAMDIYYTIDGGAQQTLRTGYPQVADWTEYEEDLPAACIGHNVQIIFKGTSNNGSGDAYLYLDDITVTEASSCIKPSDVNASAASDSKINISWTKGDSETQWNVQYSSDGGTTWTSVNNISTIVDGTSCSASLTGLTEQTTYQVQVQADCGGTQSKWVSAASVTTPCAASSFPFSEDFTGLTSGNIPACWDNSEGTTATASYKWVYNNSGHDAAPCVRFDSYNNSSENTNFLKTPNVAVTENAIVNFWYKNPAGGDFSVYYSIDGGERVLLVSGLTGQTDWKEESYSLPAAVVGHNVMIIFKGTSNYGSGTAYIFLDDVEIKAAPSCAKPTEVSGVATAYNQASISWTENNGKSAWKLQYSSNNGDSWSDEISVAVNPYTLTGLEEKTNYVVRVKTVCGVSEESDWSANSASFQTPCAPVDASDYSETFESATVGGGNLPDCWQYKDVYTYWGDDYPYVYNSGAYQGSKALYFYGGGATSVNTVVLPAMDEALNGLTVEFYYNTSVNTGYTVYASPVLGYIAADGTTFVDIETLDQSAEYVLYKKDLSSVPATAKNIAIRYANGTAGSGRMYLDNVRVYTTPNCVDPSSVTVSNVTATTADVAWTENNGANVWKLQVSNDGTSWNDVNGGANITANPYTLTGLTANHATYYVRVKSICGVSDESPWSAASAPFQTECETRSMPFSENFNGLTAGIPTCWDNSEGTTATASYKWNYYATGHEGKGVRFDSYYNSENNTNTLKTPAITISEAAMLDFWYKNPDGGDLSIYYSIDGVKQDAPLASGLIGKSEWTQASFNLPNACVGHDVVIMFQGTSNYANGDAYIYLDDVQVIEQPACPAVNVTTLAASAVTAHTATVTWEAGDEETAWNLQYKAAGAADWSSVIPVATTSSHALTGLAANTLYYVKVQANCGDATSAWTADDAFSFRTDCEAIAISKASPWSYDFEDTNDGFMPLCWERTEPYANYGYPVVAEYSYYAQSGDKYLYLRTPGRSGSSYTEDAILPVFNTEIKNLKVSFSYFHAATTSNYGQLAIGYVVGDAFTQVGELLAQVEDYTLVEREMPNDAPNGARIAVRCIGSTKGSSYTTTVYVDDIQVSLKPSCYTPTELAAAATSNGAVITWTDDAASKWNLRYRQVAEPEVAWTPANNKTSGFALTGLTPNTEYEVQVQADCEGDGTSAWSASVTFTPVCNAPSALTVTARTQSSATFTWTSSESTWVLQYKAADAAWDAATDVNVNANPFTLTELTAGTTYNARIQSACGSDFSNVVEFTTWCDSKLSLPVELTSFSAIPACWEESPAGAISIAQSKLCFVGEGEKFLYLPMTDINLNLLSVSLTFSGSLELGYISEPNGAFTSLVEGAVSGTEYDLASLAPADPKYLAIRYNGANNLAQSAISAVSIRRTPSCLMPSDVAAGSITSSSASISWMENGSATAWNLQYKLASVASWDGAAQVTVSEKPYSLSGLEQGTNYKVRVQAACAGEKLSDWSDEAEFTTSCSGIDELPFIADFSVALSSCWGVFAQDETSYKPYANTAMNQLVMDGGKDGASNNVVVMPPFSVDLNEAFISFEYKGSTGINYAQLEVGYVADKADAATFVAVQTLEQSGSWTEARIPANSLGSYIAFRYAGATSNGDMAIRNLRVLKHLTLVDTENNSATLASYNGKRVDVTIGRTLFCDGDYNTICLPFSLPTLEGTPLEGATLKAYKYAVIEPDELQVRVIDAESIVAGTPYLIKFAEGDNIVDPLFTNVTISATEGKTIGQGEPVAFLGVLVPQPFDKDDEKTLFVHTNNTLTWAGKEGTSLKSFRAFFQRTSASSGAPLRYGMRARIVEHEETATAVENIQNNVQSTKVLENDHVVIIRNGVKYNVQGQIIKK